METSATAPAPAGTPDARRGAFTPFVVGVLVGTGIAAACVAGVLVSRGNDQREQYQRMSVRILHLEQLVNTALAVADVPRIETFIERQQRGETGIDDVGVARAQVALLRAIERGRVADAARTVPSSAP